VLIANKVKRGLPTRMANLARTQSRNTVEYSGAEAKFRARLRLTSAKTKTYHLCGTYLLRCAEDGKARTGLKTPIRSDFLVPATMDDRVTTVQYKLAVERMFDRPSLSSRDRGADREIFPVSA
jgi:hypothetical protein